MVSPHVEKLRLPSGARCEALLANQTEIHLTDRLQVRRLEALSLKGPVNSTMDAKRCAIEQTLSVQTVRLRPAVKGAEQGPGARLIVRGEGFVGVLAVQGPPAEIIGPLDGSGTFKNRNDGSSPLPLGTRQSASNEVSKRQRNCSSNRTVKWSSTTWSTRPARRKETSRAWLQALKSSS
jgi:hypothetical protein